MIRVTIPPPLCGPPFGDPEMREHFGERRNIWSDCQQNAKLFALITEYVWTRQGKQRFYAAEASNNYEKTQNLQNELLCAIIRLFKKRFHPDEVLI